MERSFAARFIDEFKLYFQKNEGPLEFIKPKKKSLKQFFKSDLNHFEIYLKNNQGDLNEVDYLRGLVEYMDELNYLFLIIFLFKQIYSGFTYQYRMEVIFKPIHF